MRVADKIKKLCNVESELIKGAGGVFEVVVNGELIYSKKATGRFPDEADLIEDVCRRLAAS